MKQHNKLPAFKVALLSCLISAFVGPLLFFTAINLEYYLSGASDYDIYSADAFLLSSVHWNYYFLAAFTSLICSIPTLLTLHGTISFSSFQKNSLVYLTKVLFFPMLVLLMSLLFLFIAIFSPWSNYEIMTFIVTVLFLAFALPLIISVTLLMKIYPKRKSVNVLLKMQEL